MNSSRSPRLADTHAQAKASPRPDATLSSTTSTTTGAETKRSPRPDAKPETQRQESARSTGMNSARSNPATDASGLETFRTSMSTARVQTALAALNAEKQALLSKLQTIDAALESDEKKRSKVPRVRK